MEPVLLRSAEAPFQMAAALAVSEEPVRALRTLSFEPDASEDCYTVYPTPEPGFLVDDTEGNPVVFDEDGDALLELGEGTELFFCGLPFDTLRINADGSITCIRRGSPDTELGAIRGLCSAEARDDHHVSWQEYLDAVVVTFACGLAGDSADARVSQAILYFDGRIDACYEGPEGLYSQPRLWVDGEPLPLDYPPATVIDALLEALGANATEGTPAADPQPGAGVVEAPAPSDRQAAVTKSGTTVYVDIDAAGSGTGADWTNAFTAIQDGISAASPDDQVWVAEGTYPEAIGMTSGVAVYGGFDGAETLLSERDWTTHVTTIDASTAGGGGGPAYHAVGMNAITNARLDGFTITGGNATGGYPDVVGGGIFCNLLNSTNTIANCHVTNNIAPSDGRGGGVYCRESSPVIANCTISGNRAGYGGGICLSLIHI